jgi:peroxiredoxin
MKKMFLAAVAATFLATPAAKAAGLQFELPWMNADQAGTTYKTSDYPNAVYVIEAYFLDCPYCNENAPNVHELADEYSFDLRVQVIDLGIDSRDEQYAEWIRRHEPNHPVLKDVGRKITRQLGARAYPTVFVVDGTGKTVYKHEGTWDEATKAAVRSKIQAALQASF